MLFCVENLAKVSSVPRAMLAEFWAKRFPLQKVCLDRACRSLETSATLTLVFMFFKDKQLAYRIIKTKKLCVGTQCVRLQVILYV